MSKLFQIQQDIEQALDTLAMAEEAGELADSADKLVASQWLEELALESMLQMRSLF